MPKLGKVLFVINSLSGGGAERELVVLANRFISLGIKTSIGLIQAKNKPVAYTPEKAVSVMDFSEKTAARQLGLLQALFRLRRYVRKESPDVIISYMAHNAVLTLFACFGLKNPIVIRPAIVMDRWKTPFSRIAAPRLLRKSRGAVYQVEAQRYFFKQYSVEYEGIILPNPVKPHPLWNAARGYGNTTIAAVGRLDDQKNYPLLLRAFSMLTEDFPEWRLVIFGEGPERSELESEIKKLGLADRVSLPGFSEDIHKVLHEVSVYAMSSRYEGMPNALMEALCAGCACVTTDFEGGAARFLIQDGESGLVVPDGDADSLTAALRKLMQDEALRRRLGQNAAKLKEKVDAHHIALQWVEYLENEVLAGGS